MLRRLFLSRRLGLAVVACLPLIIGLALAGRAAAAQPQSASNIVTGTGLTANASSSASPETSKTDGCDLGDAFGCSSWCHRSDLDALSKQDCHDSGAPGQPYPTADYYLTVQNPTGSNNINPVAWIQTALDYIGNGWWELLLWVFRGSLFVLDLAYSFTLLTATGLGKIKTELQTISTSVFGAPWVAAALVAAGMAATWAAFVRGRVAESIGGLAATAVLMIAGMWIVIDPAGTVGRVSNIASSAAASTMSITTAGTFNPGSGVAQIDRNLWQTVIYRSWCELEVGPKACTTPVPSTVRVMVGNKSDPTHRVDVPSYATLQVCDNPVFGGNNPAPSASGGCTVGDLWLRWPSAQRNMLTAVAQGKAPPGVYCVDHSGGFTGSMERFVWWIETPLRKVVHSRFGFSCYFRDQVPKNIGQKKALAQMVTSLSQPLQASNAGMQIQNYQNAFTRLPILFFTSIVVISVLLLVLWLSLHVLRAAISVVVLLLMTPAALLLPGLGEGGRSAAIGFGKQLGGASIGQLFYALIGAVACFILNFISTTYVDPAHPMGGMVLMAVVAAGLWAERERIASAYSLGTHQTSNGGVRGSLQTLATMFIAARMATMGARAAVGITGIRPAVRGLRTRQLAGRQARFNLRQERAEAANRAAAADEVYDENQARLNDAEPIAAQAARNRAEMEANKQNVVSRRAQADQAKAQLRDDQQALTKAQDRRNSLSSQLKRKKAELKKARRDRTVLQNAEAREYGNYQSSGAPAAESRWNQALDRVEINDSHIKKLKQEEKLLKRELADANKNVTDGLSNRSKSQTNVNNHTSEITRLDRRNAELDRMLKDPATRQAENIVENARTNGIDPTQRDARDRAAMWDDNRLETRRGRREYRRRETRRAGFDYSQRRRIPRGGGRRFF